MRLQKRTYTWAIISENLCIGGIDNIQWRKDDNFYMYQEERYLGILTVTDDLIWEE